MQPAVPESNRREQTRAGPPVPDVPRTSQDHLQASRTVREHAHPVIAQRVAAVLKRRVAKHLRAGLVAGPFSDEQLRILLRVRIDDVDDDLRFSALLEQVTLKQFGGHAHQLRQANPVSLDEFVALGARTGVGMRMGGTSQPSGGA